MAETRICIAGLRTVSVIGRRRARPGELRPARDNRKSCVRVRYVRTLAALYHYIDATYENAGGALFARSNRVSASYIR